MMQRLVRHVRRQIVGYIALFVALGGVSYAAVKLPANSVGARQIKKGAITKPKLAKSLLAAMTAHALAGAPGTKGDAGAAGPPGDAVRRTARQPRGQGRQGRHRAAGAPGRHWAAGAQGRHGLAGAQGRHRAAGAGPVSLTRTVADQQWTSVPAGGITLYYFCGGGGVHELDIASWGSEEPIPPAASRP